MRLYPAQRRPSNFRIRFSNFKIRRLRFVFIILSTAFLETIGLANFKIFGIGPNISLIVVLYFALFLDFKKALILNIILGLIKDSLSGNIFGYNLILFIIFTLVIWFLRKQFYKEDFSIQFAIVCVATVISSVIFAISHHLFSPLIFLEVIYTLAPAPLLFKILKKCVQK